MAEKTVTVCDRCGQPTDEDMSGASPWFRLEAQWCTYMIGYGLRRHIKRVILCPKCRKVFWKMMNKPTD